MCLTLLFAFSESSHLYSLFLMCELALLIEVLIKLQLPSTEPLVSVHVATNLEHVYVDKGECNFIRTSCSYCIDGLAIQPKYFEKPLMVIQLKDVCVCTGMSLLCSHRNLPHVHICKYTLHVEEIISYHTQAHR